jgi:prefoldin subunit 5
MKMTLEQLAEKIDALSSRMDKVETKVDDLTSVINKSKGVIGFLAWGSGLCAVIYSIWK